MERFEICVKCLTRKEKDGKLINFRNEILDLTNKFLRINITLF